MTINIDPMWGIMQTRQQSSASITLPCLSTTLMTVVNFFCVCLKLFLVVVAAISVLLFLVVAAALASGWRPEPLPAEDDTVSNNEEINRTDVKEVPGKVDPPLVDNKTASVTSNPVSTDNSASVKDKSASASEVAVETNKSISTIERSNLPNRYSKPSKGLWQPNKALSNNEAGPSDTLSISTPGKLALTVQASIGSTPIHNDTSDNMSKQASLDPLAKIAVEYSSSSVQGDNIVVIQLSSKSSLQVRIHDGMNQGSSSPHDALPNLSVEVKTARPGES